MARHAGKTALVTGAASGIGRATALVLATEGASVACLDVDEARLGETEALIADRGGRSLRLVCDLREPDQVEAAIGQAVEWDGRLDAVASCAGVASMAHTTDVTLAEWDRLIAVNLTGTFLVLQRTIPALLESSGAAVAVSSIAGRHGRAYISAYSAAKGGVEALVRALAVEYAHRGARFNCVAPGTVDTPLTANLPRPADAESTLLARGRALVQPPAAQPEAVASAISYLLSDDASFVTGSSLVLDGGAST